MRILLPVAVLGLAAGCGGNPAPITSVPSGWSEEGKASWYGPGFHGKRTASGEVYDMEDMTAAHRRLPFGTRVAVRNLENGRRAVVRINDRGPFVGGRILDLSRAAARELGVIGPGVARVRLTLQERSPLETCSLVQAGAFSEARNASDLAARIRRSGGTVRVERGSDGLSRVLVGPFADPVEAEDARRRHGGIIRPCGGGSG